MKNINNIDLAYAAGYIDGDGCFYTELSNRKKFIAVLIVISTNENICHWFKNLFNMAGSIQNQRRLQKETWRTVYSYRVHKIKALPICHKLLPLLIEKKIEAQFLIDFCESSSDMERIKIIEETRAHRKTNDLIYKDLKLIYELQRSTIVPTEKDFAYFAGFLDAEGCFTISRYKPKKNKNYIYKAVIEANNSKASVFLWILQRFGGVVHFRNLKKKNIKHRDQFIWMLSAKNLNKILHRVYPYLKQKKQLCQELIDFQKTIVPLCGAPSRASSIFQAYYKPILDIREKICSNVKDLNKKGQN